MQRPRFSFSDFYPGDPVVFTEGAFEGFEGTVGSIDQEHNKLTVLIEVFGKVTPVEIEESSLRHRDTR
jgi:transcriptional antiterminator NusG